jgi:hypothetical protein
MRELAVRVSAAVAVLTVLGAALWYLLGADQSPSRGDLLGNHASDRTQAAGEQARREPPERSTTSAQVSASPGPIEIGDGGASTVATVTPRFTAREVLGALQRIQDMSRRLMPPGYEGVYIGMPLAGLTRVRSAVVRDSEPPRADGTILYSENDPGGARVLYLLARGTIVSQVQFLARLRTEQEFAPHLSALVARYGTPSGIWDCPESADVSPMRRFTWRHEGASAMEAVLVHASMIAVTLIVAPTEDVGAALNRAHCEPITSPAQLEHFPTAQTLRGERTNTLREVPRDGGH